MFNNVMFKISISEVFHILRIYMCVKIINEHFFTSKYQSIGYISLVF